MVNIFLRNEESGLGVDFDVLDRVMMDGRRYVILLPASETDQQIADALSDGEADGEPEADAGSRQIWILEEAEVRQGETLYLRVEEDRLQQVFQRFLMNCPGDGDNDSACEMKRGEL